MLSSLDSLDRSEHFFFQIVIIYMKNVIKNGMVRNNKIKFMAEIEKLKTFECFNTVFRNHLYNMSGCICYK